jgi:cholesterol oxidase
LNEDYDAVVVGSGFGGSVSAYRLADAGLSVLLLERGRSWAPGSFPRNPREIGMNFWNPDKGLYGLFDVWSFKGIEALVSSCLGGGSIIYANVFIRKPAEYFVHEDGEEWPVTREELEPHYDNVEAVVKPQAYPFAEPPYSRTPKTHAMQDAAARLDLEWSLPKLAVTFGNPNERPCPGVPIVGGDNLHGVPRYTCRLCGECNIGCNFGSKNTLDLNYLTLFERRHGEIRTLAEAKYVAPLSGGGYTIEYVDHADGARAVHTVTATRVVLAAGSFGTTYLLLRSRRRGGLDNLSPVLGRSWCGNGDLLGFLRRAGRQLDPATGPVITSATRYPGERGRGYYIEDGGYPNFANWLVETTDAPGAIRRASRFAWRRFRQLVLNDPASNLGEGRASSRTLPLLGMGRDVPDGRLYLDKNGKWLQNDWTIKTSRAYYGSVRRSMRALADVLDAKFDTQPLWYFKRNVTVHPVGGCPMGASPERGVVDSFGQVYGYPGLSIADGSALPGPVGPNPSFTIAALADRFADRILEQARS